MKSIILACIVFLSISCGGSVDWSKQPNGMVATSNKYSATTTKGSVVYSAGKSTVEQRDAIDAGLEGAFIDARVSGYTNFLDNRNYVIRFPKYKCVPSPEQRIPSFQLRADDYDGTEFDQYNTKGKMIHDGVGVILAAEMVTSMGGEMIVCPDMQYLTEAVRNGAEHIIIYNNDAVYYQMTWFHGTGFYHPLLPKRTGFSNSDAREFKGGNLVEIVQ